MILKQRFADGRTNYKDIGNDFMFIQPMADDFEMWAKDHFTEKEQKMKEDCIGFICYNKTSEPIFKDFPQWIYSNDGQLFMILSNGGKVVLKQDCPTLKDWHHIIEKMNYYNADSGALIKTPDGSYTVLFNIVNGEDYGDKYITREHVLKMIETSNN